MDEWSLYDATGEQPVKIDSSESRRVREGEPACPDGSEVALVALKRAAQRAREVAIQTGTPLLLWRDGRIVYVDPRSGAEVPPPQDAVPHDD